MGGFHFYVKKKVCSSLHPLPPHQSPTYLTHIHRPHLNISPRNGQDGTGAPRGCADRTHRLGILIWLYRNYRMVGKKRGKMLLPVFLKAQIQKVKEDLIQPNRPVLGPVRKLCFKQRTLTVEGTWHLLRSRCSGSAPSFLLHWKYGSPAISWLTQNCGGAWGGGRQPWNSMRGHGITGIWAHPSPPCPPSQLYTLCSSWGIWGIEARGLHIGGQHVNSPELRHWGSSSYNL